MPLQPMHTDNPTTLGLHTVRLLQPMTLDAVPRAKLSPGLKDIEMLVLVRSLFVGRAGKDDGLSGLKWEMGRREYECWLFAC